jgi:hypothetical protein
MALVADHPADRAAQLTLATERLTALIEAETAKMEARLPLSGGAEAEEKNRLANTYRLELARVKQDPELIRAAPAAALDILKQRTLILHEALARHEAALNAVKVVSEGLVQAMAEEVVRQRNNATNYSAKGALRTPSAARSAVMDRRA